MDEPLHLVTCKCGWEYRSKDKAKLDMGMIFHYNLHQSDLCVKPGSGESNATLR